MSDPEPRDRRSAGPAGVRLLEGRLSPERGPHATSAASGPLYRLRPSVEPFVDGRGDLYLVRAGAPDLVVRDPDPADVALVTRLAAGAHALAPLAAQLRVDPAALRDKLASLCEAGVALAFERTGAPLDPEDAERFARQLPYFAELGDEHALQRRLRAARVTVIGCGGLGTWALATLASAGVGRFVLVDDDVVELSNLNRQVLYRRDDVGRRKVAAAAAWVRAFDPAIAVTEVARRVGDEAGAAAVVDGADAVLLLADWPPYELARWVNAACVAARVPFVVGGQVPPVLKVGPAFVPGAGACFACHEAALRAASPAYDDYVAWRRATPLPATTLGPASCLVGGFCGLEVMHLLLGLRPATQDAAYLLDMRTLELRREPVARAAGCPACEHLA